MVTDTDQYYNYNIIFEIIMLQNIQNWKQLLSIPKGLDGGPAARPSASENKLCRPLFFFLLFSQIAKIISSRAVTYDRWRRNRVSHVT